MSPTSPNSEYSKLKTHKVVYPIKLNSFVAILPLCIFHPHFYYMSTHIAHTSYSTFLVNLGKVRGRGLFSISQPLQDSPKLADSKAASVFFPSTPTTFCFLHLPYPQSSVMLPPFSSCEWVDISVSSMTMHGLLSSID